MKPYVRKETLLCDLPAIDVAESELEEILNCLKCNELLREKRYKNSLVKTCICGVKYRSVEDAIIYPMPEKIVLIFLDEVTLNGL